MRYIKNKILENDKEAYRRYLKKRGIKKIIHHSTTKLKHPDLKDMENFDTINYIWKTGDRFFKLADKYYGDPELHWIIVTVNNITSRYDWPLDQVALSAFVRDKYDDPNGIHHYEINATSGDTTKKLQVSSDTTGALPVTNYEHEQTLNDNKRQIRLLDRAYVTKFTEEFRNLIRR